MINLKFLNNAVEVTDGNEFRVLYIIANTLSLRKEGHTKIYREMIADKLNLSTKQVTRLTNSLVEKGLLKKDLVSNGDKSVCYYSLNLDKSVNDNSKKLDKNVPLNKRNNIEKKEKKEIKENNIEKQLDNDSFIEDFEKPILDEKIPDEETIAEYMARMQRQSYSKYQI